MKNLILFLAIAATFIGLGACASKKKQAYQPMPPAPEVVIQK